MLMFNWMCWLEFGFGYSWIVCFPVSVSLFSFSSFLWPLHLTPSNPDTPDK
jgi:hypothetical protein